MVFQAVKRRWRGVAAGLLAAPLLAEAGGALAQPPGMPNLGAPTADVAVTPGAAGGTAAASPEAQAVKQLTRQAREAMRAGDTARAQRLALQAQTYKVKQDWWEDSPERVLADLGRAGVPVEAPPVRQASAAMPAAPRPAMPSQPLPSDPHALLRMGRDSYAAGNLDQAQDLAHKAEASGAKWGLFDDTPAKLLADVTKAKGKRDRAESDRLLLEARTDYTRGKLDDAERKAYTAAKLHGPYSVWDLGDRPHKVLGDVQSAREKLRAANRSLPPVPQGAPANRPADTLAASNRPAPLPGRPALPDLSQPPGGPVTPAGLTTPAAADPGKQRATVLVLEARSLMKGDRLVEARMKLLEAQRLNVRFSLDEDRPERVLDELTATGHRKVQTVMAEAQRAMAPLGGQAPDYAKAEERLTTARQLAVGLGLDSQPVLDQLLALNRARSGPAAPAVASAAPVMPPAPAWPAAPAAPMPKGPDAPPAMPGLPAMPAPVAAAMPKAPAAPPAMPGLPAMPVPTESPAVASRLDGPPPLPGALPAMPAQVGAVPPAGTGREMLDKARLELRHGRTDEAQRLTVEVYKGNYGLQDEASALLRSIGAEESGRKEMTAVRSYEAGLTAFQSRDYAQARAIFQFVDASLLPPEKQSHLREVMATPQMMPPGSGLMTASAAKPADPAAGLAQAGGPPLPVPVGAPALPASPGSPAPTADFAKQVQALQEVEFQKLRDEGLKVMSEASRQFQRGETDAALNLLEDYLAKVKSSDLEANRVAWLTKPVDHRLSTFTVLKKQQDLVTGDKKRVDGQKGAIDRTLKNEEEKKKQVAELLKQSNELYEKAEYRKAELCAMRAHEVDPDNAAAAAAIKIAQIQRNQVEATKLKDKREQFFMEGLNDAENEGPAVTSSNPLILDADISKRAREREATLKGTLQAPRTEIERGIERKLSTSVSLNFSNKPLDEALDELHALTGLNIVPDLNALQEEGVTMKQPMTLKGIEQIPLKSALTLLLEQAHLTFVISDNVLKVTSRKYARGKQTRKVFSVADLVIPIDNYSIPASSNLSTLLNKEAFGQKVSLGGATPFNNPNSLPPGQGVSGPSTPRLSTDKGGYGLDNPAGPMANSATVTQAKNTIEDQLIKLITSAVAPETWLEVGGSGTVDYFPIGMALVINQTPDVLEQVEALLESLRRLQDLEVAVEVRIITLAETFFERIGLDFALNIKTDKSTAKMEPSLVSGMFKPAGFVNDNSATGVVAGITPAGTSGPNGFTSDLDIPLHSTSFNYAIPPFGGFPNSPGANGGLSLGLAFLNDIQVFMFMEAAQGDRRTNVMQAPKLTLFNGQTATITVSDQQFFVTNVTVVSANGQIVFSPNNTPIPTGVNLAIQAVVSADRRFVRMNIAPTLSNLASAIVPLFPVTVFVTPIFEGGFQGNPIPFTQFIQQPTLTTVTINTTVAVPDGGTVLLGGIKTLSEGRNEFGPPVLSKIPYVNRLFKNVGYGRDTQSLMLMVTPRIIINTEEEIRQTGVEGGFNPGGIGLP